MADIDPQRLIQVARVAGGFGVRGDVRLTTFTEDPAAVGAYGPLLDQNGAVALTLSALRPVKGGVVAKAKEVTTKEQADALRGLKLFVPRAALPEPDEDEFYLTDLIGLSAETPAGEPLGRVKAVHDFGAGDLLEVEPGPGRATVLYPFTKAVVPTVDLQGRRIVIDPPTEVEGDEA